MRQIKAMRRTGRTLPKDKNKLSFEIPRIYTEATKILKQHEEENVPLKTLMQKCSLNIVKRKRLHDLLAITVKNKTVIKTAIRKAKFHKKEQNFDPLLARILAADLMVRGKLEDQSKAVQTILKYKDKLMNRLDTRIDTGNEEEMEDALPIYARINTLLSPIADVHTKLASEGYTLQESKPNSYDEYLSLLQDLGIKSYMQDYHIEGLLVFPPNSSIKDSSVYKEKAIILQDKASCLPVFLSDVKTLANVIEACAGAGHQASQIAAVMHNTGDILAVERDKAQYEVARGLLKSSGATNVTCKHDDFTLLQGEKHPEVEHIFVNAPCSATCADEFAESRIVRFASFQAHLLKSALAFPSVKEVVYSTVSENKKENEDVVKLALNAYGYLYELEDLSKKLDGWKHFGREGFDFSSKCLRTETGVDKVGSLFVAKFVRKANPDPKPVKEKNLKRKRLTPAVTVDENEESMEVVEVEEENEEDYPSKKRRRH